MNGTYILLYANMRCNCCCCQHPPTGCIICGVRNNLTSDPAKHKRIYLLRRYTQFFTCMAHISSCMPTCAATAAAANIHQPDASYAVSEITSHLTRQSTRGCTKPASKVHTVFHMYGTYILLYANMCCNCCCCQHPPTGCIICGVRNNLTSVPAKHLAYCLIGLPAFRPAIAAETLAYQHLSLEFAPARCRFRRYIQC